MLSVFLIHIASLMSLPSLSDSRSITLAFAQYITWFSLQTWSVIADLLQILAALVFSALVKIHVMLSTSLRCSFTLAARKATGGKSIRTWIRKTNNMNPRMGQAFTYWPLEVSPDEGFRREAKTSINSMLFLVVLGELMVFYSVSKGDYMCSVYWVACGQSLPSR